MIVSRWNLLLVADPLHISIYSEARSQNLIADLLHILIESEAGSQNLVADLLHILIVPLLRLRRGGGGDVCRAGSVLQEE